MKNCPLIVDLHGDDPLLGDQAGTLLLPGCDKARQRSSGHRLEL